MSSPLTNSPLTHINSPQRSVNILHLFRWFLSSFFKAFHFNLNCTCLNNSLMQLHTHTNTHKPCYLAWISLPSFLNTVNDDAIMCLFIDTKMISFSYKIKYETINLIFYWYFLKHKNSSIHFLYVNESFSYD